MKGTEFLLFLSAVAAVASADSTGKQPRAAFSLASYYASNMVLQMSPKSANVWGYGEPGATVTVSIDELQNQGQVGDNGMWSVALDPHGAGGPYTLTATQESTGDSIELQDVYYGDVWLCSGQSNMQLAMSNIFNSSEEISEGLAYSDVRYMYVGQAYSATEQDDVDTIWTQWTTPSQDSLPNFSALCFLYGRRLNDQLKIPIGLVESNWGGTIIEAWSSPEAIRACNATKEALWPHRDQNEASVLWNAMIHPLLKLSIKGVIWYQGESNVGTPNNYTCMFPTMIDDWKSKFFGSNDGSDPTFPFGFVQLAPYNYDQWDGWSFLRWSQTADYGYVPNPLMPESFMAAAFDLPDDDSPNGSIHPRDKQTVADRLSWAAFNVVYHMTDYPTHGPQVTNLDNQGSSIVLTYDSNIQVLNNEGFSVYCNGAQQNATISSHTENSVTVDLSSCPEASRLAYEWWNTPCKYKQSSIYATDQYELPAPTWIWDLA